MSLPKPRSVMTLFGTRPEIIKLAPVIRGLDAVGLGLRTLNVCSGQHDDLLRPFIRLFNVRVDHDLNVMRPGQSLNEVYSRLIVSLDTLFGQERPDLLIVQGDTTTALAGAQAAFYRRIPVGHVEAGLRSGDRGNPYPEELNRQLITRLASYHFAATARNRDTLLAEGVAPEAIFLTGNPVVDSLLAISDKAVPSSKIQATLDRTIGLKRIVLTTHRRENFGVTMAQCLRALRLFVERHEDVALIFPVHPNPAVRSAASLAFADHKRIHILEPLDYSDFIALLASCWLIVSDSGGVQEEAPTLGKPLLILRDNTERPEAIDSGVAKLVGADSERLEAMLEEAWKEGSWVDQVGKVANPFGNGDSGSEIAERVAAIVGVN